MGKLGAIFGLLLAGHQAGADPIGSLSAPYVATFETNHEKNQKTLTYVAAAHHSAVKYPIAMQDPTFETVVDAFSKSSPQAVVIEGVDPPDLARFHLFAERCAAANYTIPGQLCDEPELATHLAIQAGVPVYTGEPAESTILSAMAAHGYSPVDVISFYIMRDIPAIARDEPLTSDNFPAIAKSLIVDFESRLGLKIPYALSDFASWYQAHMPVPANYLDLTVDETGPKTGPGTTLLQQMSAVALEARDAGVVAAIQAASAGADRVMVVFGASHLDSEEPAIEALWGAPTSVVKLY